MFLSTWRFEIPVCWTMYETNMYQLDLMNASTIAIMELVSAAGRTTGAFSTISKLSKTTIYCLLWNFFVATHATHWMHFTVNRAFLMNAFSQQKRKCHAKQTKCLQMSSSSSWNSQSVFQLKFLQNVCWIFHILKFNSVHRFVTCSSKSNLILKRSSAHAEKPARRDIISSRGRKSIGNWLAAVSYVERVLTYRQATGSHSVFRPKISKSTRVTIIH